jgi:muconolactone delta-isomerase
MLKSTKDQLQQLLAKLAVFNMEHTLGTGLSKHPSTKYGIAQIPKITGNHEQ